MSMFRWIIASMFLAVFAWLAIGNLWLAIKWCLFKKSESFLPLAGGICGVVGLLVLPVDGTTCLFWIPLLADLGCIFLFTGVLIDHVRKHLGNSFNDCN